LSPEYLPRRLDRFRVQRLSALIDGQFVNSRRDPFLSENPLRFGSSDFEQEMPSRWLEHRRTFLRIAFRVRWQQIHRIVNREAIWQTVFLEHVLPTTRITTQVLRQDMVDYRFAESYGLVTVNTPSVVSTPQRKPSSIRNSPPVTHTPVAANRRACFSWIRSARSAFWLLRQRLSCTIVLQGKKNEWRIFKARSLSMAFGVGHRWPTICQIRAESVPGNNNHSRVDPTLPKGVSHNRAAVTLRPALLTPRRYCSARSPGPPSKATCRRARLPYVAEEFLKRPAKFRGGSVPSVLK
jgi:hypothetical protein